MEVKVTQHGAIWVTYQEVEWLVSAEGDNWQRSVDARTCRNIREMVSTVLTRALGAVNYGK